MQSLSIRNALTRNDPLHFGLIRNKNPLNFSTIRNKKIAKLIFFSKNTKKYISRVVHPSDPANQRIILKIVGFQNTLSGRSLNRIINIYITSQMFIQFFQRMNHHKLFDIDSQKSVNYRGCGIVKDNWLISSSKISNHRFKPICCREISCRNVTTI